MKKKIVALAIATATVLCQPQSHATKGPATTINTRDLKNALEPAYNLLERMGRTDPEYVKMGCAVGAVLGSTIGLIKNKTFQGISIGALSGTIGGTFLGAYEAQKNRRTIAADQAAINMAIPAGLGFITGGFAAATQSPHILLSPFFFTGGGIAGSFATLAAMAMGSYWGRKLHR